jgi:hypothetical protein
VIARQVIYARDIQNFFGKGQRMAYKMIAQMKKHFNKKSHQPITIRDFCIFYGIERKDVVESILAAQENLKPSKN